MGHQNNRNACKRAGSPVLLALALVGGGLFANPAWAEGGSADFGQRNAQDDQNRMGQAATMQGLNQTTVPSGGGFAGPR
ncbi:MAG: hypothetical protein BM558_06495 [Roseobacter sp. MedPE-SW]|nr:MAG: hypothetical protein BM558_06495 [Roseobacter sp. MedPE-SW]